MLSKYVGYLYLYCWTSFYCVKSFMFPGFEGELRTLIIALLRTHNYYVHM